MSTVPLGTVMMYAGDTSGSAIIDLASAGWLVCDGSLYRRTSSSYSALFTVIGTAFGGNPDHFAVPSFQGVFPRGVTGGTATDPDSASRTSPRPDLPETGNTGDAVGSLQTDALLSHVHTYDLFSSARNCDHVAAHQSINKGTTATQTSPAGAAETRPVNIYVNYIIKFRPSDAQIPVGAVVPYSGALPDDGTLAVNGWFACDGAPLGTADFPNLEETLQSAYGAEGGTFFVPDYRGRFLRGVQGTPLPSLPAYDPDAAARGAPTQHPIPGNSGNRVGSVQQDGLRSHTHAYSFNGNAQNTAATAIGFHGVAYDLGTETRQSGPSLGAETRPGNIYVNYLIKARIVA